MIPDIVLSAMITYILVYSATYTDQNARRVQGERLVDPVRLRTLPQERGEVKVRRRMKRSGGDEAQD